MQTIKSIANTGMSAYESVNTGMFASPNIKIPTLNPGAVAKKKKKKKVLKLRKPEQSSQPLEEDIAIEIQT